MPQNNDIIKVISMKKGRFIVLDGVDGSGKGVQAKGLNNYIFDRDKTNHVVLTREPFNSEYYAQIRKILKESSDPRARAEELADLFVKDRKVHAIIIQWVLGHGFDVVSDRYKYSTLAYQQTQGIALEKLIAMHQGVLVPDLILIIDIPVDVALARIAKDKGRDYKEVFEEKQFQEELRQNFLSLPKQLPDEKIVIVDGNRSPEEVFQSIKKEVDKIL